MCGERFGGRGLYGWGRLGGRGLYGWGEIRRARLIRVGILQVYFMV